MSPTPPNPDFNEDMRETVSCFLHEESQNYANGLSVETILHVPRSPRKIGGTEIASFLNCGQKYNISLICSSLPEMSTGEITTNISLGFFDNRHGVNEDRNFQQWYSSNNGQNLIFMEPLSQIGIFSLSKLNHYGSLWQIKWNHQSEINLAFYANCVGTDFGERTHGCEGVIMTLRSDSFTPTIYNGVLNLVLSAEKSSLSYARIKVFKFRGADRKLKEDLNKYKMKDAEVKMDMDVLGKINDEIEKCTEELQTFNQFESINDNEPLHRAELNLLNENVTTIQNNLLTDLAIDRNEIAFLSKQNEQMTDYSKKIVSIDRELQEKMACNDHIIDKMILSNELQNSKIFENNEDFILKSGLENKRKRKIRGIETKKTQKTMHLDDEMTDTNIKLQIELIKLEQETILMEKDINGIKYQKYLALEQEKTKLKNFMVECEKKTLSDCLVLEELTSQQDLNLRVRNSICESENNNITLLQNKQAERELFAKQTQIEEDRAKLEFYRMQNELLHMNETLRREKLMETEQKKIENNRTLMELTIEEQEAVKEAYLRTKKMRREAEIQNEQFAKQAEIQKIILEKNSELENQRLEKEASLEKKRLEKEIEIYNKKIEREAELRIQMISMENQRIAKEREIKKHEMEMENQRIANENEMENQRISNEMEMENQRIANEMEMENQRIAKEREIKTQEIEMENQRIANENEMENQRIANEMEMENQRIANEMEMENQRIANEIEMENQRIAKEREIKTQEIEMENQKIAKEREIKKHEIEMENQRIAQETELKNRDMEKNFEEHNKRLEREAEINSHKIKIDLELENSRIAGKIEIENQKKIIEADINNKILANEIEIRNNRINNQNDIALKTLEIENEKLLREFELKNKNIIHQQKIDMERDRVNKENSLKEMSLEIESVKCEIDYEQEKFKNIRENEIQKIAKKREFEQKIMDLECVKTNLERKIEEDKRLSDSFITKRKQEIEDDERHFKKIIEEERYKVASEHNLTVSEIEREKILNENEISNLKKELEISSEQEKINIQNEIEIKMLLLDQESKLSIKRAENLSHIRRDQLQKELLRRQTEIAINSENAEREIANQSIVEEATINEVRKENKSLLRKIIDQKQKNFSNDALNPHREIEKDTNNKKSHDSIKEYDNSRFLKICQNQNKKTMERIRMLQRNANIRKERIRSGLHSLHKSYVKPSESNSKSMIRLISRQNLSCSQEISPPSYSSLYGLLSDSKNASENIQGQTQPPLNNFQQNQCANNEISYQIMHMNSEQLNFWLQQNGLFQTASAFSNYPGTELLRLSSNDLSEMIGRDEDFKLKNLLQHNQTIVQRSIFLSYRNMSFNPPQFLQFQILLNSLTVQEFLSSILNAVGLNVQNFEGANIVHQNGTVTPVDDNIIASLQNNANIKVQISAGNGSPNSFIINLLIQ